MASRRRGSWTRLRMVIILCAAEAAWTFPIYTRWYLEELNKKSNDAVVGSCTWQSGLDSSWKMEYSSTKPARSCESRAKEIQQMKEADSISFGDLLQIPQQLILALPEQSI
ncbi:hypothetical protein BDW66DRAFT_134958 [Aspergillus desertorum]